MNTKLTDVQQAVYEALGEASMAWTPIPSGVFRSTRCKAIGDRLIAALNRHAKPTPTEPDHAEIQKDYELAHKAIEHEAAHRPTKGGPLTYCGDCSKWLTSKCKYGEDVNFHNGHYGCEEYCLVIPTPATPCPKGEKDPLADVMELCKKYEFVKSSEIMRVLGLGNKKELTEHMAAVTPMTEDYKMYCLEKVELPILELAAKKCVRLRCARNEKGVWVISLRAPMSIRGYRSVVHADTYALAEASARAFLEGLDDVKEVK